MPRPLRILVVAQTSSVVHLLASWWNSPSYEPVVVGTFSAAKLHLELGPDLLVTELKLGEHNGLHLALRARAQSIPAVVIGHADPVLERDAQELGAIYLRASEVHRDQFLAVVDRLTTSDVNAPSRSHIAWLDDSAMMPRHGEHRSTPLISPLARIPGLPPLLH